jgi:beta-glucosidase
VDQVPTFEDYAMQGRTYRYFGGEPLYAFGYGMSYRKFAYSNLKLSSHTVRAGEGLEVGVNVQNVGKRDGEEVAQLYLSFPAVPESPRISLRGFTQLHLAAGESRHVHFKLVPRDLSDVSQSGDQVIRPGNYGLSVGGGQPGPTTSGVAADFRVEGPEALPE